MRNVPRRSVLMGLGSAAAAGGVVFGTSAFTTVEATRSAEISVVGDASALLALEPIGPGENETGNGTGSPRNQSSAYEGDDNPYADFDENDNELELKVKETDEGASGVNPNARTVIRRIFLVTNQGTQDVEVTVSPQYDPSNRESATDAQEKSVTFFDNAEADDGASDIPDLDDTPTTISPGEDFAVSLEIDTTNVTKIPLNEVKIVAKAVNASQE